MFGRLTGPSLFSAGTESTERRESFFLVKRPEKTRVPKNCVWNFVCGEYNLKFCSSAPEVRLMAFGLKETTTL